MTTQLADVATVGARIIEESGSGIAVSAGDAAALADAVSKLRRIPAHERQAMGRRGREYFERQFERSLLVGRLEQWTRDLAAERRCAS